MTNNPDKEAKFTLGPWVVNGFYHEGDVYAPAESGKRSDAHHICRCFPSKSFEPKNGKYYLDELYAIAAKNEALEQIEANAHLISAAPDMYESLKEILESFEGNEFVSGSDEFETARAALSKANGGSND